MSLSAIEGVLFDLDGTLYSRSWSFKVRLSLACIGDLGLLRRLPSVRRELAERAFETEAALLDAHHRLLAARCGVSPERARRFYEERLMPAFIGVLRRHVRPRPGLVEQVRELAARGVACCVLSDHGQVEQRLEALGIDAGLFRACASSASSGAFKPAPVSFLQMAERCDIPPSRWLVVGDRADADAAGATAAGMAFLGVCDAPVAAPDFLPWPRVLERLSEIGRHVGKDSGEIPPRAAAES